MWQDRPHHTSGQAEPAPDSRGQQDVDVLLAGFATGAVKDQFEVAFRKNGQRASGGQPVWKMELDDASKPLMAHIQRPKRST